MKIKDFEAVYKPMADEQLQELAGEMGDLVPEARTALIAELRRRALPLPGAEPPQPAEGRDTEDQEPAGGEACGDGQPCAAGQAGYAYLQDGPPPADWIHVPRFTPDESVAVAAHMDQGRIPFRIVKAKEFDRPQYLLAVPRERLGDCVAALKQYFGLVDEAPEPFTGECPGCGAKVEGAVTCPACDLVLCQDSWDLARGHPFVRFLNENGLGRAQDGGRGAT